MKGLMFFVSLAAGLVILLFFLGQKPPAPAPAPAPAAAAAPAAAPPVAPAAAQVPAAAPAAALSLIHDPRVQNAAASARVTVRRFDRMGAKAEIETEWSSDVTTQGMDFVEALRRAGVIRDFDLDSAKLSHGTTPDGRRLMIHRVTVIF